VFSWEQVRSDVPATKHLSPDTAFRRGSRCRLGCVIGRGRLEVGVVGRGKENLRDGADMGSYFGAFVARFIDC
jgi:hypothetical protein